MVNARLAEIQWAVRGGGGYVTRQDRGSVWGRQQTAKARSGPATG
jgi:hypothetical protein